MIDCRHCRVPETITPGRHPWGDGPAPAWHCRRCGRHIARRAPHFVVDGRRHVLCADCHQGGLARDLPPGRRANRPGAWRLLLDAYER